MKINWRADAMGLSHEQYIGQIIKAAEAGELSAAEAINEATASGDFLVIGKAETTDYNYPVPAQTVVMGKEGSTEEGYWAYRILNETGNGAPPVTRAGSVASTAIHAALGGDLNFPNERMQRGLLLTPPDVYYQYGTIGWNYDATSGGYIPEVHQHLMTATEKLPDDTVIGAGDLVRNIGFDLQVPDEPGHYASINGHETRGSLPIRMGDVRANLASAALVNYYTYVPLLVQR